MDLPVLYEETVQLMDYCQLLKHPKYTDTWTTSYSNEMGQPIFPGARWNLLPPGTLTHRAYTAT